MTVHQLGHWNFTAMHLTHKIFQKAKVVKNHLVNLIEDLNGMRIPSKINPPLRRSSNINCSNLYPHEHILC